MNNKDLIKQYVDTGLRLPEEQITQLPTWAMSTYLRKRLIASKRGKIADWLSDDILTDYELSKLDKTTLSEYINNRVIVDAHLSDYEFSNLQNEDKVSISNYRAKNGHYMNDEMFKILPNKTKKDYIDLKIKEKNTLSNLMLSYVDENDVELYLKGQLGIEFTYGIDFRKEFPKWYNNLDFKLKIKTFELIITHVLENGESFNNIIIPDEIYKHLGPNRKYYLKSRVNNKYPYVSELLFNDLSEEDKITYVKRKHSWNNEAHIYNYEIPYMKYVNNEQ